MAATRYSYGGRNVVILMNITGDDPHAAIRTYGDKVLPAVRDRG